MTWVSSMNAVMSQQPFKLLALMLVIALAAVSGCQGDKEDPPTPVVAVLPTITPTPASSSEQIAESTEEIIFITVATDAPSRFKEFEDINPFGDVIGFDPDVMAFISNESGVDYEFVVTGFDGLLVSISDDEFDAAMSALIIPEPHGAGE